MAWCCAPQPGCLRISANNTHPRPSQSLWECHPNSLDASRSLHRPLQILYNAIHGCFLKLEIAVVSFIEDRRPDRRRQSSTLGSGK
jgi:hypothetical protein